MASTTKFTVLQPQQQMKFSTIANYLLAAGLLIATLWWLFFAAFSLKEQDYLLIRQTDQMEAVHAKLSQVAAPCHMLSFKAMAKVMGYNEVKPGRYKLKAVSTWQLLRNLRNGHQATIAFNIPTVNLPENLAAKLGKAFSTDSTIWARAFQDSALLATYGMTPHTLFSHILVDQYELYWNMKPEGFLKRMQAEADKFWNENRIAKAQKAGLTREEVLILASIVEKETTYEDEKARIAGLYLNRLHKGMRLQADPTVKYALKNFGLKRIRQEQLKVSSPYNTYATDGLPPGPICLPSKKSIHAVLEYEKHPYIYMCAKEDLSGAHNFATTYEAHLANAKRYAEALNKRGIN